MNSFEIQQMNSDLLIMPTLLVRYDKLGSKWKYYIRGALGVEEDTDERFFEFCGSIGKTEWKPDVLKFLKAFEKALESIEKATVC